MQITDKLLKNHINNLLKMNLNDLKDCVMPFLTYCQHFYCVKSSNVASMSQLYTRMFFKVQSFSVYMKGEFKGICLNEKSFSKSLYDFCKRW